MKELLRILANEKRAERALEEKIIALETLAEIDTEILLAENSNTLFDLVCRRATGLLKASKAIIASIGADKANLLAFYGFEDFEGLLDEFTVDVNSNIFTQKKSFAIRNLKSKNFNRFMARTREREDIHTVIGELFEVGNNFRAILAVFDAMPREWNADDRQLLKFLAGQIAISFEKTRLLSDAEYRAENFETLYSVAGEIASKRDLASVLDVIVELDTSPSKYTLRVCLPVR